MKKVNGWHRQVKQPLNVRVLENVLKEAKAKWFSAREVYDRAWLEYEEAAKRLKDATSSAARIQVVQEMNEAGLISPSKVMELLRLPSAKTKD